jgi:phosphatidylglycerol:prolipoprotein diacylglycerol transferase
LQIKLTGLFFMSLSIILPVLDPVALDLGPVTIKWYGLAYMVSLLLGWAYTRSLAGNQRLWGGKSPLNPVQFDDLLLWVTLGVVVGGRLGYVLFYNPLYFFANPSQIIATWNGGMSFHGGLLGSLLAIWIYSKRHNLPVLSVLDVASAVAPLGFYFGRLANFINGELWGRVTDVPWAMVFPNPEAGGVPRHPSQLYEAALEGFVLFLVLRFLTHGKLAFLKPGLVTGTMILGYGLARIFVENFRQFDEGVGLMIGPFTPGMIYSVPMVVLGAYLIHRARSNSEELSGKQAKTS